MLSSGGSVRVRVGSLVKPHCVCFSVVSLSVSEQSYIVEQAH